MTISERIKLVRGDMSRRAFGDSIGVSGSVVQNIEEADTRLKGGVPEHIVRLISNTYRVRYEWLKYGDGEMYTKETPPEQAEKLIAEYAPNESEFAKSIIRAFAYMSDGEWYRLKDIIEKIRSERD